jgi:FtsH-binding integral membrane protein
MSDFNRGYSSIPAGRADMAVDAGLRAFMLGVYNKVALGLVVSAALAFVTGSVPAVRDLMFRVTEDGRFAGYTLMGTVVTFAPIAMLFGSMFIARARTAQGTGILYWAVVASIGASLGVNVLLYTGASIATTFLITAASFGALSLAGYTTKKDLTGFGSFLIIGLFGILIAMLVNIFVHSAAIAFIVNVLGVLIFAGLIAYDTQRLKMTYYALGGNQAALGAATNIGALNLYINFINLFQFLMGFLGNRR